MSTPAANLDQGTKQPDSKLSELRQGSTKLERSCTLRLKSQPIKVQVTKILLNEARRQKTKGFSQKTKVVPQAFRRRHEQPLIQEMLLKSASPALATKLRDDKIAIMPGLSLGEHVEEGDEYVVECNFEIKPDIPATKLDGIKLRKPIVDVSETQIAKIIQRICEQNASYAEVKREARSKDRVKADLKGSERMFIVDHPQTPSALSKAVLGKSASDTIVIKAADLGPTNPDAKAEDLEFSLLGVEEPTVPELTLEFIKKFIPAAKTVEEFKEELKSQLLTQGNQLARQIMSGRAADALERATDDFELPKRLIETYWKDRLVNIEKEAKQRNLDTSKINEDEVHAVVTHEVRTALVLNQYATVNDIKVTEDEFKENLDNLVANQQNPDEFRQQLQQNPNQLRQLEETMVRGKVSDSLYGVSEVEEVTMSLDELERIVQTNDPETRRLHGSVPSTKADTKTDKHESKDE